MPQKFLYNLYSASESSLFSPSPSSPAFVSSPSVAVNDFMFGLFPGVIYLLSLSFLASVCDSMLVVFRVLNCPFRLQPTVNWSSLVFVRLNFKVKVAAVGDKFSLHPPFHGSPIPIPFMRFSECSVAYLKDELAVRTSPKIFAAFL